MQNESGENKRKYSSLEIICYKERLKFRRSRWKKERENRMILQRDIRERDRDESQQGTVHPSSFPSPLLAWTRAVACYRKIRSPFADVRQRNLFRVKRTFPRICDTGWRRRLKSNFRLIRLYWTARSSSSSRDRIAGRVLEETRLFARSLSHIVRNRDIRHVIISCPAKQERAFSQREIILYGRNKALSDYRWQKRNVSRGKSRAGSYVGIFQVANKQLASRRKGKGKNKGFLLILAKVTFKDEV